MHEMMQTIVTDDRGVSRGSSQLHCAKTALRINVLFGVNTWGPTEHCVTRGP